MVPSEASSSFRVVILSELLPRAEYSTTPEPLPDAVPIDRFTFDDVMRAMQISLNLELDDPFGLATKQRAPLRLDSLKAFRPSALAEQVAELRGLRAAHGLIVDFELGRRTLADAIEQVRRAVGPRAWAEHIVELLSRDAPVTLAQPSDTRGQPAPRNAAGLDALLDMVALPGEAGSSEPAALLPSDDSDNRVAAAVSAAVRAARGTNPRGRDASPSRRAVAAGFSSLMSSLLVHPELVRLERAWRGVRLLVEHTKPRSGAELDVVPARPDTVRSALDRLASPSDAQRLRAAIDLLVVDYEVSAAARDRELLVSWGEVAEQLRAPLLAAASPQLVGFETLASLANTRKSLVNSDEGWALGLRALGARPESRWLLLALNGMLARAPHTPESAGLRDLPFAEGDMAPRIFVSAALAPAILALESFAARGSPLSLIDAFNGLGTIPNLMVHELGSGEQRVAIAVEALVASDTQRELSRIGLCALAGAKNRDTAHVVLLPMLYRGSAGPMDGEPGLKLVDQLFVGRLSRAIEQLGAAIPSNANEQAIEQVVILTLSELFKDAPPPGPELSVELSSKPRRLSVTLRPHRYCGVSLEEVRFEAPLEAR